MMLSNVIVDVTIPRCSFVFGQSRAKVRVKSELSYHLQAGCDLVNTSNKYDNTSNR